MQRLNSSVWQRRIAITGVKKEKKWEVIKNVSPFRASTNQRLACTSLNFHILTVIQNDLYFSAIHRLKKKVWRTVLHTDFEPQHNPVKGTKINEDLMSGFRENNYVWVENQRQMKMRMWKWKQLSGSNKT